MQLMSCRTPLAVLQTNLEVFEKKQEPEMVEYRQLFTMIKEQTARLSQLVGTLLDMTNLKSVPRTDQVTLEELVDEVFCDLDPVAEKAGISIHFNDRANQDSHTDAHRQLCTSLSCSLPIWWKMPLNIIAPMVLSPFL